MKKSKIKYTNLYWKLVKIIWPNHIDNEHEDQNKLIINKQTIGKVKKNNISDPEMI